MNDKAEEYPEIIFSHATGYMGNDTNFNNYFGRATRPAIWPASPPD